MDAQCNKPMFWQTTTACVQPVIAVSSCLLGNKVRYDGTHKLQPLIEQLMPAATLLAFCPEMAAGLGAPRPPVQLVKTDGDYRALGRDDKRLDVTTALQTAASNQVSQLEQAQAVAIIFKSRSPSCGLGSTPIFNLHGQQQGVASGLAAQLIAAQMPHLIAIEETTLTEPIKCQRLLAACRIAHEFRQLSEDDLTGWFRHYASQFKWQLPVATAVTKPHCWQAFKASALLPWLDTGIL